MIRPYLLHHYLTDGALRAPDRDFVIHEGRRASYGEVARGAEAWATFLCGEGVQRGDRVGLLARNGVLYVEAYYGILMAGGVAVPLNTSLDGPGVAAELADCGARVLVVGPGFAPVVGHVAEPIRTKR